MANNILDTFFYSLKVKDDGVEAKLDSIKKRVESTQGVTDAAAKNFEEFGSQIKQSLEQVLPGADRVIGAIQKIGTALRSARSAAGGGAGGRINLPGAGGAGAGRGGAAAAGSAAAGGAGGAGGAAGGAASAAGAAGAAAVSAGAIAAAVALAALTVAAAVATKAFLDGSKSLIESRKLAQEVGVNNTQMAASEQYAKSLGFSKTDAQDSLKAISQAVQDGWVKSREFGNVFGIGNEQTQMLKKRGIRTSDSNGELRNSAAIFEDIGKKMKTMSRDNAIAFGEFFGMSKDFAAGVYDSKQSLSEYAAANKEAIATQAAGMAASKAYERAQQQLANAWDDFAITVGSEVLPVLTDVLEWIAKSTPAVKEFGEALYGSIMMVKDAAVAAFDWMTNLRDKALDTILGPGASDIAKSVGNGIVEDVKGAVGAAGDMFKAGVKDLAAYGSKDRKGPDLTNFDRDMKANTSLNAKSANIQLEAANLMKTATAKFGLSIEEYAAIWAAESGKQSGLRDTGGVGTGEFRDVYRRTVGQYATSDVAVAMYGRGQPMMQQMPAQYAMGLGVTPMGIPAHAKGLTRAQAAIDASAAPVGPTSSPFGGSGTRVGAPGKGTGDTNVTIEKIEINTQSTDPEEINRAVGRGLQDQLKMAVNTHNDGRLG